MTELRTLYQKHLSGNTAISAHLPRLRMLSRGFHTVVEFGVKRGASTCAFLLEAERVVSFDTVPTNDARALEKIAPHWDYRIEDSRYADVPGCDLLFLDSLHTFQQVQAELTHAHFVRRRLIFHDVTTFGEVAADGETGRQAWAYRPGQSCPQEFLGIRPAIDDMMIRDPSWRIECRFTDSHGLLVLRRG